MFAKAVGCKYSGSPGAPGPKDDRRQRTEASRVVACSGTDTQRTPVLSHPRELPCAVPGGVQLGQRLHGASQGRNTELYSGLSPRLRESTMPLPPSCSPPSLRLSPSPYGCTSCNGFGGESLDSPQSSSVDGETLVFSLGLEKVIFLMTFFPISIYGFKAESHPALDLNRDSRKCPEYCLLFGRRKNNPMTSMGTVGLN